VYRKKGLFSTGFLTMGSEILVIFVYQILYGYIYVQIGLIVTIFLAGLMPGAMLGEKLRRGGKVKSYIAYTDINANFSEFLELFKLV